MITDKLIHNCFNKNIENSTIENVFKAKSKARLLSVKRLKVNHRQKERKYIDRILKDVDCSFNKFTGFYKFNEEGN